MYCLLFSLHISLILKMILLPFLIFLFILCKNNSISILLYSFLFKIFPIFFFFFHLLILLFF
ncbi:hypothetical protein U3516DRAFT_895455 [Neocallimastix sp. 'constans']